jgi:flagellar hook-associated protein 2
MRIGGLASGMDIDSLVADLMKAERIPFDKLTQKKQVLEWQRDDYRDMNKMLSDLDTFIFDNMTLQKDLLKKNVLSSDSGAVTATASSSAGNINTSIKVTTLAKSANWISGNTAGFIPPSADMEIELKVTQGDGAPSLVKNADGTTSDVIKLTIKKDSTMEDILNQLSSQKELGVSAFAESGKVVLTKKDTGAAASIVLNDQDAKDLFSQLGFTNDGTTGELTVPADGTFTQGVDADFTINGLQVTKASNTFSISDVTYTLHQTTGANSVNLSVSGDTDNMIGKIVQFVDKYNEMIEKIDDKLSEKRYRNYQPLSDEEKESMTEKQVEMWEERAKSGLIRNDSILSGTLTKLRTALYTPFNGTGVNENYKQLDQIGISTTSNWRDKGKLTIDEDKLRAAIEKDPNAIFAIFNTQGTKDNTESRGLLRRVRDTISDTVESIEKKAGKPASVNNSYMLGRMLDNMDNQIDRFQDRLIQVEDRYWKQFTAMEKAIQQSNQQSMYLMQQFGGGM